MSGKQFSEDYQIPYFETDIKGELTLASLVNILILASEHQLEALNVGEATMQALELGWVVTQYQIKITRMPKVDEKVKIVTEAESYNKYFCYRNFWLYDAAGNECVFVQSIFVMMSYVTRRMVPVVPEIMVPFESTEIKSSKRFPRIKKINPEQATTKEYRVRYFDIDGNQHVNNVHYFEWMLDALNYDFLMSHRVASVNIRYGHEIQYGQMTQSMVEQLVVGDLVTTRHKVAVNDLSAAEAEITWVAR
ncbi:acyl-[acyl-carrier-protein] thioesterase [Latilactobacillus graminis]|uniref:Oleoyl-[acyl-carrier protein] thioesterase n=2 Tax=Latilactobacillus graminis TaxID=60519 RepID=A0AA89I7J1_9LACO|nr:acyl-ACP thioesterase domain-containing protein [Latilactobacillus graminis]KRM24537.1 oleoyl-[acyl-carrier protein] thioesterase [Latilactobacillus graminis DSM 20719]QFP79009.1 acyl-ACP thioesterase [Latilactobacillus graminis]